MALDTVEALQKEVDRLKERLAEKDVQIEHRKKYAKTQHSLIQALQRMALMQNEASAEPSDASDASESDVEEDETEGGDEEEEEDASGPVYPLWDEENQIYVCRECHGEVDEDTCIVLTCRAVYLTPEPNGFSCSTVSQADHGDRIVGLPGALLRVRNVTVPDDWKGARALEYRELIQRGATPEMIEYYHLEHTHDGGIYAWADEELLEKFAGDGMLEGEKWKISLGARIELDDKDEDGSDFIEGLIEDAVLFNYGKYKWETIKDPEQRNAWITRPKAVMGEGLDESDEDLGPSEEDVIREQFGSQVDGGEYDENQDDEDFDELAAESYHEWYLRPGSFDTVSGLAIIEDKDYEDDLDGEEEEEEERETSSEDSEYSGDDTDSDWDEEKEEEEELPPAGPQGGFTILGVNPLTGCV